jgi:4-hydroxyproline epimerase
MAEKRLEFLKDFDWIRTGLMFEPRGHDMMSGGFLFPPANPDNDLGILFIETSGCLPMCGHGTMGMITMGLQEGKINPKTPGTLKVEVPAGVVDVDYELNNGIVTSVKITNVPSFLHSESLTVDCPELGELTIDVAYGGNFYGIIDPQKNFSGIQDFTANQLIGMSAQIRDAMNEKYTFIHPDDSRIRGMSHVLWTGDTISAEATARNAVFYGDKALDRSPCGTGTSARMAQWAAKGKLKVGDKFIHESFIGSTFTGQVEGTSKVGDFDAIIPSIQGWARHTGYNTIFIDDDDPYAHGFQVI